MELKKRPSTGWRKELKTIWAPLKRDQLLVLTWSWNSNIPGLGKGHPHDQNELEDVVEGCDQLAR